MENRKHFTLNAPLLATLYFFGRYFIFLGLVGGSLYGAGDLERYFEIASLKGAPFFSYWMEYPPVFPFINYLVFHLAGGNHFYFDLILFFLLTLFGSACIYFFYKIACEIWGEEGGRVRSLLYLALLLPLPYTWWYYEPIPVVMMLAALWFIHRSRSNTAAGWIGLGILTKWFSALLLPAIWRFRSWREALKITLVSLGVTFLTFVGLWIASPQMTEASLVSQPGRNSWQTVWAWMDGNLMNGKIADPQDRYDPNFVFNGLRGNPAVIPSWARLIVFGGLGLFLFLKVKVKTFHSMLSFVGITWAVFLLWSSGWSPQWILYLVPLILLTFPLKQGLYWNLGLIFLTLVEWPFLLAHTLFEFMGPIALIRSIMLIFLTIGWYRFTQNETTETNLLPESARNPV